MQPSEKEPKSTNQQVRKAIQGVAIFEASKGLLALIALAGLLELIHHDLHQIAIRWLQHLGLRPTEHFTSLLLQAIDKFSATPAHTLFLAGSAYIVLRWIEAWALWRDKHWGEWLGILSSSLYIPFEVHHIWTSFSWFGVAVLLINILVILLLFMRIRQRRQSSC